MLMIRLARYGAKKKPFYHVVAIDKRCARNAICSEKLGFYNPTEKFAKIDLDRVKYWVGTGARCSETVTKLLKKYEQGELQTAKKPSKPKAKAESKTKVEKSNASAEQAKAAESKTNAKEEPKVKETPKIKAEAKATTLTEEKKEPSKTADAEKPKEAAPQTAHKEK